MDIKVRPVQSKRDLKIFIELPYKLYKDNPNWVPPLLMEMWLRLDKKKNPLFQHLDAEYFIAYLNGEPVGRITAHVDHEHNKFWKEKTGFFGFFECINLPQVGFALLDAAEAWLRKKRMKKIRGPFHFNTNDESGLLVSGFHSPSVTMMPYHHPYYQNILEAWGLKKVKDLVAYIIRRTPELEARLGKILEKLHRAAQRAVKSGFKIRRLNLKKWKQEAEILWGVYNQAWSKNWGFVPMNKDEFLLLAKGLKDIVKDTGLALIIESPEGEPAAFGLAIPDLSPTLQKSMGKINLKFLWSFLFELPKSSGFRIITLGVVHKFQKKGVDALLYYGMLKRGLESGYKWCEASWMLEDNYQIIRPTEFIGGHCYKVYRIYEKPIRSRKK